MVEALLTDIRVDPASKLNYAIRGAVDAGHVGIVTLLLKDPRVDPTVLHNYCIRSACEKGFVEVQFLLLTLALPRTRNCDSNQKGNFKL